MRSRHFGRRCFPSAAVLYFAQVAHSSCMEEPSMSREQSVSTTLKAALIATLVSAFLTGCIFSPDKKTIDTGGGAPDVVKTPEDLIQVLAESYRTRDIALFSSL